MSVREQAPATLRSFDNRQQFSHAFTQRDDLLVGRVWSNCPASDVISRQREPDGQCSRRHQSCSSEYGATMGVG